MTRPEEPLERAERIGRELRAATAEAAGVLKDLLAASKAARTMVDGYYSERVIADLNKHTDQWNAEVERFWKQVRDHLREITDKAVTRADVIIGNANTLSELCTAVAAEVLAHTVYDGDNPMINYGVDHRTATTDEG